MFNNLKKIIICALLICVFLPLYAYGAQPKYLVSGTGFFINRDGYMITNAHVVKNCLSINVKGRGDVSEAKVVAVDNINDLALLKTKTSPVHIASLRYNQSLKYGDEVTIIGYPEKRGLSREYLVKTASIIDTKGPMGEKNWLQFTDIIKKGNSGGPLLDSDGNVVGVITARIIKTSSNGVYLGTTDVAVNTPVVEKFLYRNKIGYNKMISYNQLSGIENNAKKFVVNVHCYQ